MSEQARLLIVDDHPLAREGLRAVLEGSGYRIVGLAADGADAVVKAELFPARIRALGVGLPYALTVSIFGGTAEYVGTWLKLQGRETWFFWYVSGCILCSLALLAVEDYPHRLFSGGKASGNVEQLVHAGGRVPPQLTQ